MGERKMPCVQNYENYPSNGQTESDWCIPASIENLMRFCGSEITQQQIMQLFDKEHGSRKMCFATMASILTAHYGSDFDFITLNHATPSDLIQYVEDRIIENKPVIVSIEVFNGWHMWTVLCIDAKNVKVIDTARPGMIRTRSRETLVEHLSTALDTLIIIPL